MRFAETDRHLSVRVASEDVDRLRAVAERWDCSVSEVVREVVREVLQVFLAADSKPDNGHY